MSRGFGEGRGRVGVRGGRWLYVGETTIRSEPNPISTHTGIIHIVESRSVEQALCDESWVSLGSDYHLPLTVGSGLCMALC